MIINYHLFLLTDFTDIAVKADIGNSVIFTTLGSIIFNFGLIVIPELIVLQMKFKRCRLHRAHKKRMRAKALMKQNEVKPEESEKSAAESKSDIEMQQQRSQPSEVPLTIAGNTVTEMDNNRSQVIHHNKRRKRIVDFDLKQDRV